MSTNGIFITAELTGPVEAQIRSLQQRFDPKLANELPPHITLIGSSGAGPVAPDTPQRLLRDALLPLGADMAPVHCVFQPPHRFIGRDIVVLPLDPHGPIRALHERLKATGLSYELARYPFTPHCTLSFYPQLTPAALRTLMAVRVEEPFVIDRIRVYHTRAPQAPTHLFDVVLSGGTE